MKEGPLLMTPDNAQKCHDGTKTQTRRLNNLEIVNVNPSQWQFAGWLPGEYRASFQRNGVTVYIKCPYGVVGDRLWVRENGWERPARTLKMLREGADTWERFYFDALMDSAEAEELKGYGFKRRPSIHMPRWACRTVLEMTEVRVERLQEITVTGAIAEGIPCPNRTGDKLMMVDDGFDVLWWFRALWESIHGAGSWALNPWVWVIAFKKVRTE